MPIFFYQSLNASCASDRGIAATNSQRFTRATHNFQAASGTDWRLAMPVAGPQVPPSVPVHGPAQLVGSAPQGHMAKGNHDINSFLSMVEGKARDTHQHLVREFGRSCDLLVYGEMDASHGDWHGSRVHTGQLVCAVSTGKACNSFSVHANLSAQHEPLGYGMGWVAVRSGNVNVVFVHVPNSIAKSDDKTVRFYQDINQRLVAAGKGAIDLVMGDTNQGGKDFTRTMVSRAVGSVFANAHTEKGIAPIDAHNRVFGGTNSNAQQMYDVAVYNTATLSLGRHAYLSQGATVSHGSQNKAAAITDHMGLAVEVTRRQI
ncbi:hypothetical protein L1F30_07185 [Simiduia sp. 21SJ11W-1]|uniref:hypothetical protein n=1 Tax=Simiduia sp. 21SJ11W-1 TaxID=2909669 RepID=UPI00209DC058|nr:hypothetical protein [Simiduia sp. 21SJ11W-1]UTA49315.1 hypothetical protein L1F30_07185 [Simiduia sp. 21SJ11W-1]